MSKVHSPHWCPLQELCIESTMTTLQLQITWSSTSSRQFADRDIVEHQNKTKTKAYNKRELGRE